MPTDVDTTADDVDIDTDSDDDTDSADLKDTEPKDSFKAITSQAEFDAALKGRLSRAEKAAEKKFQKQIDDLAKQIKEYDDSKLSDQERRDAKIAELTAAVAERDKTIAQNQREKLVYDIASENNLPKKFWDRVRGDTDEEIEADIKELLEALPAHITTTSTQGPPSRTTTTKVQTTGDSGEQELSADEILADINKDPMRS